MKKIYKKSYLKNLIISKLTNLILYFYKRKFLNKNIVLVKSADGIGDILVRSALVKKIMEKYSDNVYFVFQERYKEIGKILGYKNIISFSKKEKYNLFYRIKKMIYINSLGTKKFINLEFGNDSFVSNIFADEKIGILDLNKNVEKYNKYYTRYINISKNNKKILDIIRELGEGVLEEKLKKEDIYPDLRNKFNTVEKNIVIAVGSTARDRVCSPLKMAEYIKVLNKKFPNDEILLVGNGNLQLEYAKKLIELLPNVKFKNMVNKTSLEEVFDVVAGSKIFVGFESGLYNLCFTLRKKGIGLFKDTTVPFAHEVPWLKNIGPDEKEKIIFDENYPDEKINKISVEKFEKAMEELIYE